jgi:hypothetical protein
LLRGVHHNGTTTAYSTSQTAFYEGLLNSASVHYSSFNDGELLTAGTIMKIIEKEFNAITGEEIITEREETAAETKARLERAKELAAAQVEAEAKAAARQVVLEKLGLTADEAKLLLG